MGKIPFQIARILTAIIMLQTLYFKFSDHPDSIHIFSTLGIEPFGRYLLGTIELVASIALLVPKWTLYGAHLSMVLMFGAIGSHLFFLGIEVNNDGGILFTLALITLLGAAYTAFYKLKAVSV